jgi:hypothetical protein
MLAVVTSFVLAIAAAIILAEPAAACDCAGISTSRALRQADAVFRGKVLSKRLVGHGADARTDIRFDVDGVFKGTVFRQQVVASSRDAAGCGLDPGLGGTWVIFAIDGIEGTGNNAVDRLVTSLCSGNLPTASAPAILGTPRRPLDGASDREERSTDTDEVLTRGLAIGGIALLFVGAVVVMGLAVLWRRQKK